MISFKYKEKEYKYPSCLKDILLVDRIDFDEKYGIELAQRAKEIAKIEDPQEKDIAEMEFNLENLCKNISFFSNIPLEEVYTMDLKDILTIVGECEREMFNEKQNITLQPEYLFNDEIWEISSPFVGDDTRISFGEFIHAKEIVRLYEKNNEGNFKSLLELCIIFFRKKGEDFDEVFLSKNSERRKIMEKVTMDIALSVAFFLTSSIKMYLNNSQFSQTEEHQEE